MIKNRVITFLKIVQIVKYFETTAYLILVLVEYLFFT